ncbi:Sphingosine kinase [Ectocarpus siliculosus]|uniref:Sphingosine kinase n=1 Tax=Ectocarpus siliculosus TaxID=2880 RepID=D8LAS9_ECTSI|nr:Sphingosine kinase [Ectocarpus siliculosus]|eukprot:CBN76438.1 Sphingosine kinase [Ectocarpus siliculosus]
MPKKCDVWKEQGRATQRSVERLAVVMAVEDVPPSTSLLGSSGDQHHHHEEEQQQCKRCILQDDRSFRSLRDHKTRPLCLTSTSLEYYAASGKEDSAPLILSLADVVGAKAGPAPASGGGQRAGGGINGRGGIVHQLQVFAYVASGEGKEMGCTGRGGPCRKNKRRATHQTWLASDPDTAQHWATEINNRLRQSQGREEDLERGNRGPGRRLLVLVNPVSGTGESRSTWEKTLRPMLEQAMTTANVVFSTRRGELAEIITNAGDNSSTDATRGASAGGGGGGSTVGSLDDLDGIVVVGGDGTFFEVLQGMYARPDCARQLSRLSLGIVPAGSGNGLAKTVSVESGEWFGAVSASFLAAKGQTKAMDLLLTESADKKYLAFLNVGWGMISDVDIESEAYRWMGSLRFTVGTIVRIANLKHYRGRISFLPDLDAAAATTPTPSKNASASAPFRMPPLSEPVHQDGAGSESAAAGAPALEGWTSVEGEFILADMTQASHIAHDMPMAPHSRIGDGLIDLFFIKKGASRFAMIQMFLAMEKGGHISPRFPCISWHRVRAFRIEPLTSSGRITVDGELVDYAPLQQHVWRKAAHVFCSPDDDAERLPACLGS